MSHEIRTPMNAIPGLSHLMRQDPLTPRQTTQLERLTRSAQDLLGVIDLEASRRQDGRAQAERARDDPQARQAAKTLLVEDEPIDREVTRLPLESQGMHVSLAEHGQQAVAMARASLYDLVVMDVETPVMNGLLAAGVIRQLPGWADVPILALTASACDEDRDRCLAAGMSDYVSKPVQLAQLHACLSRWLMPHPSAARGSPSGASRPSATEQPPRPLRRARWRCRTRSG